MIAFHRLKRPRQFQANAWVERQRLSTALHHAHFIGLNDDHRGGDPKHEQLEQHNRSQTFTHEFIAPCPGNLEAELVIQSMRRSGKEAFRFTDQPHQTAVVKLTHLSAFHARPVNIQDQSKECLQR